MSVYWAEPSADLSYAAASAVGVVSDSSVTASRSAALRIASSGSAAWRVRSTASFNRARSFSPAAPRRWACSARATSPASLCASSRNVRYIVASISIGAAISSMVP